MSNVAKLKKQAAEYELKKQFDKALAIYVRLLDSFDQNADELDVALFNRVGDLMLRQGSVADAVDYYEKAVDRYADTGFFNNAIALCNKILRHSPGRASVYYKLGKISAQKGFKNDAKANFLEYADRMQKSGNVEEAFRALTEFADLCPDQDEIRLMLADQLTKAGKKAEAIEQLQTLYERYDAEGRTVEAAATADRVRAIDPDIELRSASRPSQKSTSADLIFLDLDAPSPPTVSRDWRDAYVNSTPASSHPTTSNELIIDASFLENEPVLEEPVAGRPPRNSIPIELTRIGDDTLDLDPNAAGSLLGLESTRLGDDAAPVVGTASLLDLEPTALDGIESTTMSGFESAPVAEPSSEAPDETAALGDDVAPEVAGATPATSHAQPAARSSTPPATPSVTPARSATPPESAPSPTGATPATSVAPAASMTPPFARPPSGESTPSRGVTPTASITPTASHTPAASHTPTASHTPAASITPTAGITPAAAFTPPLGERVVPDDAESHSQPIATIDTSPPPLDTVSVAEDAVADESGEAGARDEVAPDREAPSDDLNFVLPDPEQGPPPPARPTPRTTRAALEGLPVVDFDGTTADTQTPASVPTFDGSSASGSATPVGAEAMDVSAVSAEVGRDDDAIDDAVTETPAANATDATPQSGAMAGHESTAVAAHSAEVLRARVEQNPDDCALRRQLAEALLDAGDRDGGIKELESAMSGAERSGDLDLASGIAEEIVRLEPDVVRHHQKRVEYAFRTNDRGRLIDAYLGLADVLLRSDQPDKSRAVYQHVLDLAPSDVRARAALDTIVVPPAEAPPRGRASTQRHTTAPAEPAAASNQEFVNLGDWLRDDEAPKDTRMVVAEEEPTGDEQADFADMLRKFKQGVAENVDAEDYQSHYDLAIAFKEMGLLDEAIAEFQKALGSQKNRVPTFEALGQCFIEKGQFKLASSILGRALVEGLSDDKLIGVLYLLGFAAEAQGNRADALTYYQRVFIIDIQFRDIADRLRSAEQAVQ